MNLQKLISLCFQAIKGSTTAVNDMMQSQANNRQMPKSQMSQKKLGGTEKENNEMHM